MCKIKFFNCFGTKYYRCLLCDKEIDIKINETFCSKKCELIYLYKDGFKTSTLTECKYILDI